MRLGLRFIVFMHAILSLAFIGEVRAEDLPLAHPSFDCAKATLPIEKAICSDPDLSEKDRKMSDEFRKVIDNVLPESRLIVLNEQRDWLRKRTKCLKNDLGEAAGCLNQQYDWWLKYWPQNLAVLGGQTATSFTLKITKFPDFPVLAFSRHADLCNRLKEAATSNFQRPNKIHNPHEADGFVRRLEIPGGQWINPAENAETIGMSEVSVIPLPGTAAASYNLVFSSSQHNYLSRNHSLFGAPAAQLAALKEAIAHSTKLPPMVNDLVETSAGDGVDPIQVLQYANNGYLAEEQNWSEIKLSKIQPNGSLQETCRLKYPDALPIGPAFKQWIADLKQIQGEEGPWPGTAHFLYRRMRMRESLTQLAALRLADIVQFGFYPASQGSYDSPLQSKLGIAVWGLSGAWNHVKARRFESETSAAKAALADYYVSTYGVNAGDATRAVEIVTNKILVESIYFYSYGEKEWQGKTAPGDVEQGIRNRADDFSRLPADQRDAKAATDLIRSAILAGASKADIESLIAAGAELGTRSTQYDSDFPEAIEPALFFALERPDIASLLIGKGVDVNQSNAFGKTALMYAAHLNFYEALDLLLKAKAAINTVTMAPPSDLSDYNISRTGRSALMYAAENASKKLIDRLIDAGADVHATDSKGRRHSPLSYTQLFADTGREERCPWPSKLSSSTTI